MAIRLLNRQEIDRRKARERKIEVDEGLKVARTVDALREMRAKEEDGLQKWRRETIAVIHGEIGKKEKEKAVLFREVAELRKEKEEGIKELNDERAKLVKKEASLDEKERKLRDAEAELEKKSSEITNMHHDISLVDARTKLIHNIVLEKHDSARKMEEDAKKKSVIVDKAVAETMRRKAEVVKQEMDFQRTYEEKDASLRKRELALVEAERELGKREKRVRDDLKTLERNKKR